MPRTGITDDIRSLHCDAKELEDFQLACVTKAVTHVAPLQDAFAKLCDASEGLLPASAQLMSYVNIIRLAAEEDVKVTDILYPEALAEAIQELDSNHKAVFASPCNFRRVFNLATKVAKVWQLDKSGGCFGCSFLVSVLVETRGVPVYTGRV